MIRHLKAYWKLPELPKICLLPKKLNGESLSLVSSNCHPKKRSEDEETEKKMLSEDGLKSWKEIREDIGSILEEIMGHYFPSVDWTGYHKFFKADEGVFDLKGFTRVTPHECARYMNPNVPRTALMEMKRAKVQHSIKHYQVNFAVIAVLVDKQIANEQRVIENIRNLAE